MRHKIGNGSGALALAKIALLSTAATLTAVASGCGDGAICPSEIVVVFQTPGANGSLSALNDKDNQTAGIQTDVSVRSNLKKGDELVLTLTDSAGAVAQGNAVKADSDGNVTFTNVTFPAGDVTLSVTGTSASGCGTGSDQTKVTVITQSQCRLTIDEGPIDNAFFAPIPVLNSQNDSDGALADFQANLSVESSEGFEVEVFVLNVNTGIETSLGKSTASSAGLAKYATTLVQGRQAIRATCSKAGFREASATSTVQVDTVVPTCTLVAPVDGTTVTPDDDADADIQNGIQMTWRGTVDDGTEDDTIGESVSFFRDSVEFVGLPVSANGTSETNLAEFTSPGTFAVSFVTSDHSGNRCQGGFDVPVIMSGCSIVIDAPSTIVLADSDANDANGMQADFSVLVGQNPVDTNCEGLDITVDCGFGTSTATVAVGGIASLSGVTLSPDPTSQGNYDCVARVTNGSNFQTTDVRNVAWDTQAPPGFVSFITPALGCGDTLADTVANDADSNLANGFQIGVAVISPTAATREVKVISSAGTVIMAAPDFGSAVNVTLAPGDNDIRAISTDAVSNTFTSLACNIRLEDIAVNFNAPAGTGVLAASAGTVIGTILSATICVTVSEPAVTTTIALDGGAALPTTGVGNIFCTNTPVSLSEGTHTLTALTVATVGTRQGTASQAVTVTVTPPAAPAALSSTSTDHQTLGVSWTPVANETYAVRYGPSPFAADATTFLTQGTSWQGSILNGATSITPVNAGTGYFVGVVAVDAAGNTSSVSSFGPVTPDYDGTGALVPVTGVNTDARFGMRLASGDFNGDGFDDIAVAAPYNLGFVGEVYIYYGSVGGLATPGNTDITPDVILRRAGAGPFIFGYSLARINWDGAGDGLAVGSPFTNNIYVFYNGTLSTGSTAGGPPLVLDETAADVAIGVAGVPNYFSGGLVGWTMTAGQLDAAGTPEDLIIGVLFGGATNPVSKNPASPGGNGGVVVIYGGTMTAGSTITLSETATAADLLGLSGMIFENPNTTLNNSSFSDKLAYLGDTRNGNGVGDFAVAYSADATGEATNNNIVYVFRGRTLLTPGMTYSPYLPTNDLTIINPTADPTNEFGISLGSIADQNGDGFRDIVIGGFADSGPNSATSIDEGRIWIVSGSKTGTITLNGPADYLTKISGDGSATFSRVGTGVANNALVANADVNGDGREDLVCTARNSTMVWYGGSIPTGDVSAATTVNYRRPFATGFSNTFSVSSSSKVPITWIGDVDGNGMADLGLGDWRAGSLTTGLFEVLFDL